MADIKPFRGLLYNKDKVGSLEDVVAPPYDVINDEFREKLYNRHPENIVRLILGKDFDGDDENTNKYTRARDFLSEWSENGTLVRDEIPAIYLYNQEYLSGEAKKTRKGFIALVKLEEFDKKVILPHEATLAKPVEDRLKLFRATNSNLSQVFGLYPDPDRALDNLLEEAGADLPSISLQGDDGVGNEMKKLTDTKTVDRVAEFLKDKKIIIADGHHRYTTALAYKKEMEEKHGRKPDAPHNYVMMFLTNMYGEGISVGPIHRLIHGVEFDREDLLNSVRQEFDVEEILSSVNGAIPDAIDGKMKEGMDSGTSITLYFGANKYYFLRQKADSGLAEKVELDGPMELKLLDVSVVHSFFLEGLLKISREDVKNQKCVIYKKDAMEAVRLVDNGTADIACLMNATRVEQVESIAGNGYLMPQKSTFFYPKLLSGLVISPIKS